MKSLKMTNKNFYWFLFLFAGLTITVVARAEDAATATDNIESKTKKVFKSSESHLFTDLHLKGQMKKPEITYIYKRKGIRSEKIIALPENFNSDIAMGAGQF